MALGSSAGCIVPPDRCLLWPYPSLCLPPGSLLFISAWPCATRQPAEGPQFTLSVPLRRAVISTPVAPASAFDDVFLTDVVFAQLQGARQPRCPRPSRTSADVVSKLQCSLDATARQYRLPCSGQDFYFRAFAGWVAPMPASDMTRWLHRHLPSPDSHRLD